MTPAVRELEREMLEGYFARRPFAAAQLGISVGRGAMPPVDAGQIADVVAAFGRVRQAAAALVPGAPGGDRLGQDEHGADSPGPDEHGADSPGPGGHDAGKLGPDDLLTCRLIDEIAGYEIDSLRAGWQRFTVAPLPEAGLASQILTFLPYASIRTADDAELYLRSCAGIAEALQASTAELAAGRAAGQLPVRRLVQRSAGQIADYLAESVDDDRYLRAVTAVPGLPVSVTAELTELITREIRPVFAGYRDELLGTVLESARDDDRPGLGWIRSGEQIYADAVRGHTTLAVTPQQAHDIGLEQVADLRQAAEGIGRSLGWAGGFERIADRLRGDPGLHFTGAEQILGAARDAMARAERAVPSWITDAPLAECEVLPMDPVESPHGVLGHYETAPLDRHRPARYWVNVTGPSSRPVYEAQALAFHESVPGHHLEISTSQQRGTSSEFRRMVEILPYSEGWALYAEGLADEMGLYTDDLARLGMVSFALWRACRLVVDTGLHAFGWSRARAVEYLWRNTILTRANVENEIDRYIAHPGSALAYLLGRLTIERCRAVRVADTSDAAAQRAFHSELLGRGPVTMTLLTEMMGVDPASA